MYILNLGYIFAMSEKSRFLTLLSIQGIVVLGIVFWGNCRGIIVAEKNDYLFPIIFPQSFFPGHLLQDNFLTKLNGVFHINIHVCHFPKAHILRIIPSKKYTHAGNQLSRTLGSDVDSGKSFFAEFCKDDFWTLGGSRIS